MRNFVFAILLFAAIGIFFVGESYAKESESGGQNEIGDNRGNDNGFGVSNQSQGQIKNLTTGNEKNKSGDDNETEIEIESNKTKVLKHENEAEDENETEVEKEGNKSGKGISKQVHDIIEARKNGSITVPQGMLVRIIAHNHSLSVENATEILNESLEAYLVIEGKQKKFRFELGNGTMNITDDNVTVTTNETLELENDSLFVGGKKILIMPSEVPAKIKIKTIRSAVLHVPFGDPLYWVNATRKAKVLWLFDSDMDVELNLNAMNGTITSEKRPWWSFLAGVQEEE